MNQAATAPVTHIKPKAYTVEFNEGIVSGKIRATRKEKVKSTGEIVHYTVLTTKAPDEFSHPGTVEVSSNEPLGKREDHVTVKVHLTGYSRTWDKQTGPNPDDTESIATATNYLRVIDQIA